MPKNIWIEKYNTAQLDADRREFGLRADLNECQLEVKRLKTIIEMIVNISVQASKHTVGRVGGIE